MERPVMNPMFMEEDATAEKQRRRLFRLTWITSPFKLFFKLFLTDIGRWRRARFRVEDGTPTQRFLRGLFYRLAFVPLLIGIAVAALVFAGTHPIQTPALADPLTLGIYCDNVTVWAEDGTRLEGWIAPLLSAESILAHKDKALRQKNPAVLLVHDHAGSREQLLPLARPLHEAGFVVMAVCLRGSGSSERRGVTFGLDESMDVRAAVDLLRRKEYVDPNKIAVVGVGTGAVAAVLAAEQDPGLATLVLEDLVLSPDEMIAGRIAPKHPWLRWMTPLCKWGFEIAYRVDTKNMSGDHYEETLKTRSVLMLDGERTKLNAVEPQGQTQVLGFLTSRLLPSDDAVAGTH